MLWNLEDNFRSIGNSWDSSWLKNQTESGWPGIAPTTSQMIVFITSDATTIIHFDYDTFTIGNDMISFAGTYQDRIVPNV